MPPLNSLDKDNASIDNLSRCRLNMVHLTLHAIGSAAFRASALLRQLQFGGIEFPTCMYVSPVSSKMSLPFRCHRGLQNAKTRINTGFLMTSKLFPLLNTKPTLNDFVLEF